jgi:hypothetical protein
MRKRTVKILKIIAVILVVLSLLYAIAVGVSAAKLNRVYADLRKDGRPMRQADVLPPRVPDEDNAALLYESAALLLKAQPAPEGNLLEYLDAGSSDMGPKPTTEGNLLEYLGSLSDKFIKDTLDPDKLVELQQLIDQDIVTQALSIVEQGTQRPSCWFDRNYKDGIYTLLPNLPNIRELSRILSAKARLDARAGNPDNAWKMVHIQLKLADAMRNEPMDGERLILGEWAFNLPKSELYKVSSENEPSEGISSIIYRLLVLRTTFKPLFLADRAAYMRLMHKSVELMMDSYSRENANIIENEVQEHHHMLTGMLIPATFKIKELHCEMTAELRITQTGMALLQHKQSRDAFPDTLEALKLQNINDPFSEQPIRYKYQGQGFILYSIGPDQKDNGGSPKQKKQKDDWDIVWSYTGGR